MTLDFGKGFNKMEVQEYYILNTKMNQSIDTE